MDRMAPALLINSEVAHRMQAAPLASTALAAWSTTLLSQMVRGSISPKNGMNWEDMLGAITLVNLNAGSLTIRRSKHVKDGAENVQKPSSGDEVWGEPEMTAQFGIGEVRSKSGYLVEQPIETARALMPKFVSVTRQLGNQIRAYMEDTLQAAICRGSGVGGNLPIASVKDFYTQSKGAAAGADRDAYEAAHYVGFVKDAVADLTMRQLNGERQSEVPAMETILGTWTNGENWERGLRQDFTDLNASYTADQILEHTLSYAHLDELNRVLSEQETYRFPDTAKTPFLMPPFRGMPNDFVGGRAKAFPLDGWAIFVHNKVWNRMKKHSKWEEYQKDAAAAVGFDAGFFTGNLGKLNGFQIIKSNGIPVFKRGNVEIARNYLLARGAVVVTAHNQTIPAEFSAQISPRTRSFMEVPVPVRTYLYAADKEAQRSVLKWCLSAVPHVVGWTDSDGPNKGKNPATGIICIESPFKPTA